jgi:hypothetical protein
MKMSDLLEGRKGYCSDKCCGADVKAKDCTCKPTCSHCSCNAVTEDATAGSTSSGNIATIASVPGAKRKVSKKGKYGAPKAPQATNADGTAKNAQDINANLMGGTAARR